tara:strand:- start:38 stop:160 length:123 start_codon:yes stop_codon:yes gene_type:complete
MPANIGLILKSIISNKEWAAWDLSFLIAGAFLELQDHLVL